MPLSFDEIERYARQLLLPEWGAAGQERVRAATAIVHGEGPAAHTASLYLAAAGIGNLKERAATDVTVDVDVDVDGDVVGDGDVDDHEPRARRIHIRGVDDREAIGAACAVEALKAILGLPHRTRVTLALDEPASP